MRGLDRVDESQHADVVVEFHPSLVSFVLERVLEGFVDGLRVERGPNGLEIEKETTHVIVRWTQVDGVTLHDGTPRSRLDDDRLVFLSREDRFRASAIPQNLGSVVRDTCSLQRVGPQFVGRRVQDRGEGVVCK